MDIREKIIQKLNYMNPRTAITIILSSIDKSVLPFYTKYLDNYNIYEYSKETLADFIYNLHQNRLIDLDRFFNYYPEKDIIDPEVIERYPFLKSVNDIELEILKSSGKYVTLTTSYIRSSVTRDKDSLLQYLSEVKSKSETCKKCTLRNNPFVMIDTSNMIGSSCDVLFVGEAPGEEETKLGKPFVGKSGQLLRNYIARIGDNVSYCITNTCLCRPPSNRTPYPTEIECCLQNLITVIETLNPKLIVAVGLTSYRALTASYRDKKQVSMNNVRGITSKFKDIPVYTIYHPSYILRSGNKYLYDEDFFKLKNYIHDNIINTLSTKLTLQPNQTDVRKHYKQISYTVDNNLCYITLDKKYYDTSKYQLLNIERYENYIIYLFKNLETNETEYVVHDIPTYFYSSDRRQYYISSSNVNVHYISNSVVDNYTYEKYLNPITKCYTDYKLQAIDPTAVSNYSYCILDIEILADTDEFPDQIAAKYPVNLVSLYSSIDNKLYTYVLDSDDYNNDVVTVYDNDRNKLTEVTNVYKIFKTEQELLVAVMEDVRKHDVVLAWNVIFDLPYIYNRMKNIAVNSDLHFTKIVPFKPVIDMQYKSITIPGMIVLDALGVYKSLTYADGEKESYKLDYIATVELNSKKTSSGEHFYKLWSISKKDAIYYNQVDTLLTKLILDKYYAVDFVNQLRHLYGVNWNMVGSISLCVESMIHYLLKQKGYVLVDKERTEKVDTSYEGAFIHEPLKGIFFISTFDFSSLYPSIMITCNIDNNLLKGKIENVDDFRKYIRYRLYGVGGDEVISVYITDSNLQKIPRKVTVSDFHNYVSDCTMAMNGTFFRKTQKSILAELEEILLSRRKVFKKSYEETGSISDYVKQHAYKIAANSVYGYLGFEKTVLYDKDLAEAITKTGQILNKYCSLLYEHDFEKTDEEILDIIFTKYPTVNHQLDRKKVVYGDTDSIMIVVNQSSDIDTMVSDYEKRFNERLRNLGTSIVGSDNVVWKLSYEKTGYILPVTKKRYALYQIHPKKRMIIKGLEVRKVNYPKILRDGYMDVLYMLLRDRKGITEVTNYIREVERAYKASYKELDIQAGIPATWNSSKEKYKVANPSIKGMLLFNTLVRKVFVPGSRGYQFDIKFNPIDPQIKKLLPEYIRELMNYVEKVDPEKEYKSIQSIVIPYDLTEDDKRKINELIRKKIIVPLPDKVTATYWYGKLKDFGISI